MEKSDKRSIVIASIFLVILFSCLGFVIYVKMTYGDKNLNNVNTNVNSTPSLSLTEIVTSFNNSEKVKNSLSENAIINMVQQGDGFVVNYSFEDTMISLNGKYSGSVLTLNFNPTSIEETVLINVVFDELVNISCVHNGYNDGECTDTVMKFLGGDTQIEGLGYVEKSETDVLLVIDTSKKIALYIPTNIFANNEIISVDTTDYVISGNNVELINSNMIFDEEYNAFTYSAIVKNLSNDSRKLNVIFKVYDENKIELKSQELDNNINGEEFSNEFGVSFAIYFDETITRDSIKYFSVDFITE